MASFDVLAMQHLTEDDLEQNRAGRMSSRQRAQLATQRRRMTMKVLIFIAVGVVMDASLTLADYAEKHDPLIFIFTGVLGGLVAFLWLMYVLVLRLPSPDSAHAVTAIEAPFERLLVVPTRSQYLVRLHGVVYRGLTGEIADGIGGVTFRAYVLADHKLIVGFEPLE